MKFSEQTDKMASALALAAGEFGVPRKNRKVTVRTREKGTYDFSYCTLDEVIECVRPALTKHHLVFTQGLAKDEQGGLSVVTRLLHESGQWAESSCPIVQGDSMQELGSAYTYGKRYGLTALLGVVADEDEDGNLATGNTITQASSPRQRTQPPSPAKESPPAPEPPEGTTPDSVVLGEQGANALRDQLKRHGITLADLRLQLGKMGLREHIKGKEAKPQLWPLTIVEKITEAMTIVVTMKATDPVQPMVTEQDIPF